MSIHKISTNEKEIILVGTAHISKKSAELAKKTIEEEQPDIVAVELDEQRLRQLLSGNKWENTNLLHLIQSGQSGLVLLNLFLANMQKKLGEQVGVKPGEEMLTAIKTASEQKKPLVLVDRNIQITMKRALKSISFIEKIKLAGSLIMGLFSEAEKIDEKKIEEMKEGDLITKLMNDLSREYPKLKKTLVDERDQYITHKLLNAPGKKIVAIIGAGHVKGVIEHIHKHQQNEKGKQTIKELETIPEKGKIREFLPWIIPIGFVIAFAWVFATKGIAVSLQFLLYWIVVNGTLSALAAIIAGAHYTTAIGVFLTSWIASLHPMIATGWIAAAMELKRNSPSIKDFKQLGELNSLGDFRKNRVTRILWITILCNIGSMIGTLLVIPYLLSI